MSTSTTTRLYWCSFADTERPEGSQFLGACVVEVSDDDARRASAHRALRESAGAKWIVAARHMAHALGCHPGGEMVAVEITDVPAVEIVKYPRGRLLSKADLDAIGLMVNI